MYVVVHVKPMFSVRYFFNNENKIQTYKVIIQSFINHKSPPIISSLNKQLNKKNNMDYGIADLYIQSDKVHVNMSTGSAGWLVSNIEKDCSEDYFINSYF